MEPKKIAVLGDADSVKGFAALGLDVFETDDAHAEQTLKRLCGGTYAVIYLTERLALRLEAVIEQYADAELPAIIPIPGVSGNTGMGLDSVKKSVERAVGSDILFG